MRTFFVALLLCLVVVPAAAQIELHQLRIEDDGALLLELIYPEQGESYIFRLTLEWWTTAGERGYVELDAGRRYSRVAGYGGLQRLGNLFDFAGDADVRLALLRLILVPEGDGEIIDKEFRWSADTLLP